MSLRIVPIGLDEANAYVSLHHRHHKPVPGAKFCIGVVDAIVVGVAIVGRPVARGNDDSMTLELNRLATDGTKNACSALLGAVRRAGFALGYTRIITYTLIEEGGASLRSAGWKLIGERGGGSWNCATRPRVDTHPLQTKLLWEA